MQRVAEEDGDIQDKAPNLALIPSPGRIPGQDRRPGWENDG